MPAAQRGVGRLEPGHIVALPAVEAEGDVAQRRQRTLCVHPKGGVALLRYLECALYLSGVWAMPRNFCQASILSTFLAGVFI